MAKTVNKKITDALKPFGLPVADRLYEGTRDEFFYFILADDAEEDAGDDMPEAYVSYMQIHYCCPWTKNYSAMRKEVRAALLAAGFTAPSVTDASVDGDRIRHLVFECSIENDYDMED